MLMLSYLLFPHIPHTASHGVQIAHSEADDRGAELEEERVNWSKGV